MAATRQLDLKLRTWGGKRPCAGRPPRGERAGVPHAPRPPLPSGHPALVTWRLRDHVWNLRSFRMFRALHAAFAAGSTRPGFRLVHYSVQGNHVHLLAEAAGAGALARGLQGLAIRSARKLNRRMGRAGKVFADRYHARPLGTPREVRNALVYVLQNAKKHLAQAGRPPGPRWVDPYSSGSWFDGWREPADKGRGIDPPWLHAPPPVASPSCWLLRTGWRRDGLIGRDEVPRAPRSSATL